MSFPAATKQQKFCPNEPGVARDSFYFLFILFISFILLIEFNYVLTFLKDARERGAHDDCQSPLPGQVGPGLTVSRARSVCDCAIHTYSHDLARPRRTLQEAQNARAKSVKRSEIANKKSGKLEKPKESRKRQQKDQKNQTIPEKQIEKNERKALWTLAVTSQCRTTPW